MNSMVLLIFVRFVFHRVPKIIYIEKSEYFILQKIYLTLSYFTFLTFNFNVYVVALCFDGVMLVNVNFTLLGYDFFISKFSETDVYRCSTKYFLKILRNIEENICVRVSFLLQISRLQRRGC